VTRPGLACNRRQAGFTLFEMLLTLAIAASLAVMVMPNFGM
jgi:prepilin-type N-terminal cleavage/methylation domain-containing protein